MCLVTTMRTPFTAKKDLVIYKVLSIRKKNGKFTTPSQEIPVELNNIIKPDTDFPEFLELNESLYSTIKGGAIHAYVKMDYLPDIFMYKIFKSIVHEGTKFYVSTDGTEIATEELYITDEKPTDEEIAETQEYIMTELIAAAEQHNGVRVGDILLSDKSFVHVEDYNDDGSMTAIGVVGYFIKGKPISIGLESKRLQWALDECQNSVVTTECEAYSDYNGRKYTDNLYAAYKDRLADFPALKYCVEYKTKGTKKGDWYFPSSGEVANIGRNLAAINNTLWRISRATLIKKNKRYWCSAENSAFLSWGCHIYYAKISQYNNKCNTLCVLPVFAE